MSWLSSIPLIGSYFGAPAPAQAAVAAAEMATQAAVAANQAAVVANATRAPNARQANAAAAAANRAAVAANQSAAAAAGSRVAAMRARFEQRPAPAMPAVTGDPTRAARVAAHLAATVNPAGNMLAINRAAIESAERIAQRKAEAERNARMANMDAALRRGGRRKTKRRGRGSK